MSKEQSKFAHNFKRTTAAGVDTRVLRAQRRSMEWKESRDQVVSRKRNVGAMSPVLEAKDAEQNAKETRKKSSREDASLDKVANRKAQLMKWKEQKELRKKVEELEKAKKKPFRVVHVEPVAFPVKNLSSKLKQVPAVSDTNVASAKLPSTRSKTIGAEAQRDVPTSRNTRSKVAPVVASGGAGARNTHETRSKSSAAARTEMAGKTQKKAGREPTVPDKAKLPAKAPHVKVATGIVKTEVKTTEGPERATRSRSRTTVVLDSVKAAAPPHLRSVSSSSGEMSKMFDFSHSGMKKVNLKRGSESLFAPADFCFTAPENVKPFSFSKLNSSNEASDIERKMAMIEISTDEAIFSSGGGGASAKRQTRKSTKITSSTPRVPGIQEKCHRTPAVSAIPSKLLTIVPAADCIVLVDKLQGPITSQSFEDDDNVGPVFSMVQGVDKKQRRKSRRNMSTSPVDENRNGDRSRSSLRRPERRMDDHQKDNTSPDELQRSLHSLKKRKSKSVDTKPVLRQLADSNVVGFVTRKSLEKVGADSVASQEAGARSRRSIAEREVTKRSEEGETKLAYPSEDVPAAPGSSEKDPKNDSVGKKNGRRGRKSAVPKTDVALATEGSKRRSVKLISSVSVSDSNVELAEKTANEEHLVAVEDEKTLKRVVGARRSVQGKLAPGSGIFDNDGEVQIENIPEENLSSELAENEPKKVKSSKNSKRKSVQNLTFAGSAIDTNGRAVATEVVMEMTETSFKASLEIVTESRSQRTERTGNKGMESRVENANAVVFQTPSQPIRAIRSRSIALGLDSSLKRKTPKNVRNSLILRALSPEEGVEVLRNSPMIELNRRKLKSPPTGGRIGKQMLPVAPMPNFDDLDVDTDLSQNGSADRPGDVLSSVDTGPAVVSSSTSVESLEADDPYVPKDHPVEVPVSSAVGTDLGGVKYFRCLLSSEADRLKALCLSWKKILISDAEQINEEVSGQIRTTIGQAELLMGQRFRQFSGLVDHCEFKTGEKEVGCTDLQGFWDMIYYQVEDVDKKFSDLDKLMARNWVVENVSMPVKPNATKKKVDKRTKTTVTAKKATSRPNFAEFRQKLKQQQQEPDAEARVIGTLLTASPNSEVKTFDGGFFKVDSPVQKKTRASTEKLSSLLDVGNTPKATTSVARVVLQRMTRKSLIQSIQDSEEQNLILPSGETNLKHACPNQSQQSTIIPNEEQHMTSVSRNKKNDNTRRSTRKSVCFSEVVTDCDLASNFSKYLMASSDSVASTPDVSCQPEDKSLLASMKTENTPVVNVEMDEVPVKGFKGLKLGFTPGVDGKSRRISSFTPLSNVEKSNAMSRINENSEIVVTDLMSFSPLISTPASNGLSAEKSGRKSGVQRRCSTRRSVANKSRMSLL